MKKFKKSLTLVSFFILLVVFLSSCSNDSQMTITESFAGSGGPGDFYKIKLNMTDNIIKYDNLTTNESGQETFVRFNNNLYEIEKDLVYFAKMNDEILIVGDQTRSDENGLLTAVKERKSEYGSDIDGTYNVATSMEGWVGKVIIDSSQQLIDVKLDTDYDGIFGDTATEKEIFENLSYNYNDIYNAIEINESSQFKHYGVFINDEIGIFDSYMWENNKWVGDGMFILIKQNQEISLSDYAGNYYSLDKDGTVINFGLNYNSADDELKIEIDGQENGEVISASDELPNISGVFEFEIEVEENVFETHRAIFLPGKAIIVAYEGFENQEGSAGLFVGVKAD